MDETSPGSNETLTPDGGLCIAYTVMIQLASSDEDAGAPCSYARCLDTRAKHGSSNVTLSYAEPILMVRAAGTKMYDELDREWLDCVNNVAHVGHCSPTVRFELRQKCHPWVVLASRAGVLERASWRW